MPLHNEENPLWYKDAVIYEVHIRSFCDSNGDGIGDIKGLITKLPYLEELGVTAVWLLPFYPSPLRDEGYDIADYLSINPDYGTLNDFKEFLREAHRRGIRVITELVLNHTSDQHAWFQRARRAQPGSAWRNYYVWSGTPDKYREARIIFKDFESSNWTWDQMANAYYWHRFYSHQPDLNFDNPRIHAAMFRIIDHWLAMGVDGFRLDAVPYLYERDGTICENLPEVHAFLKKLRAHLDGRYADRVFLAEANQWPEDATSYFGEGDECHMAFHFPLMPRMFMALQMEERFPIIDILEQTPRIPDTCQWALFLRNHDELTLEMVTDEERDYMYHVYARDPHARLNLGIRRRLSPLMGNDRRKIELMNVLLFTLPGTPILYYGDEIGMGDNYYLGDRNGVRTPMQWSPDRNAGFSMTNPQRLYLPVIIDPEYNYEAINVETQTKNPSSLLWWMRRMISLRKRYKAFGRGSLEFGMLDNPKVLAFIRRYGEEIILVLANFSRFTQMVEINRTQFAGYYMEDLFSHNRFPVIKDSPYVVMLGPHDYFLLQLKKGSAAVLAEGEAIIPEIQVVKKWQETLEGIAKERLEREIIPEYLEKYRRSAGKRGGITRTRITDAIPVTIDEAVVVMLLLDVTYAGGETAVTLLPLHFAAQDAGRRITEKSAWAVIARLRVAGREGVLCDAVVSGEFRKWLFEMITRKKRMKVKGGVLKVHQGKALKKILADSKPQISQILHDDPVDTGILFDNIHYFKLYRQVAEGINPEAEIDRFLTDTVDFAGSAPFAGTLEYNRPGAEPITLGLLRGYIPNQGDAMTLTLEEISRYFELLLSKKAESEAVPFPASVFDVDMAALPDTFRELTGEFYLEMIALLGRRTGELHLALSSGPEQGDFAPEPFSRHHQRSVYQSAKSLVRKAVLLLGRSLAVLPDEIRTEAERVLAAEQQMLRLLERFLGTKFTSARIRIHGNYNLKQALFTGKDFMIIDFPGEPAQVMSERRIKRSPLHDVAGMMRSLHYAAYTVLQQKTHVHSRDIYFLEPWVEVWYRYVSGIFLHSYLTTVSIAEFVPGERDDLEVMLTAYLLRKALSELIDELENRPDWAAIPLRGIKDILENSRR